MDNLNIEKFGINMKRTREALKMSQKELAEKVNVTPTTISSYEKQTKFPTLENAVAIANTLNTSIDTLCGGTTLKCKTYNDVIQYLLIVIDTLNGKIINFNTVEDKYILLKNHTIQKFLNDSYKVRELYLSGTIDEDLYIAWKEKQFREYDYVLYDDDGKITDPYQLMNNGDLPY